MPSISVIEARAWMCDACNSQTELPTWVALDGVERPDLSAALGRGDLTRATCACGEGLRRGTPLLITRLTPEVHLIVAVDNPDAVEDPMSAIASVVEHVRESLGEDLVDVPGPALVTSFEAAELFASRDIRTELARREEGEAVEPSAYGAALDDLRDLQEHWAIHRVRDRLIRSLQPSEFVDILVLVDALSVPTSRIAAHLGEDIGNADSEENREIAEMLLRIWSLVENRDVEGASALKSLETQRFFQRHIGPRHDESVGALEAAKTRGDHASVVALATEHLGLLGESWPELEGTLRCDIADALLASEDHRPEHVEQAIAMYERALDLLDSQAHLDNRARRAAILINLGAALGRRSRGDPSVNVSRAVQCLEHAVALLPSDDTDSLSLAHSNLGLALAELARTGGADLDDAIRHLRRALKWRSLDRDPRDWAYTQLNLAMAFARRQRGIRRRNLARAALHGRRAVSAATLGGDSLVRAQAEHNLASQRLDLARLSRGARRRRLLREGEEHAERALEAWSAGPGSHHVARTWEVLGNIRLQAGNRAGALSSHAQAVRLLNESEAWRECRDEARLLATLREEDDDLEGAADAWEVAVSAADQALASRASLAGRLHELRDTHSLFRFAAHASARVGRLWRAAEILEHGRGRELTLLTHHKDIELDTLRYFDPGLHEEYVASRAALDDLETRARRAQPISDLDLLTAVRRLELAVERVRLLPGFNTAYTRSADEDISAAVTAETPVVYLVSAPSGSVALVVRADETNGVAVEAVHAADLSSRLVAAQLVGLDGVDPSVAYLRAQAGDGGTIGEALGALEGTVGSMLLSPLADYLRELGARSVCLIPTGLLTLLPLHAIAWGSLPDPKCLLDEFNVSYSPSAGILRRCMARQSLLTSDRQEFLVVANPLPHSQPLPGAEFEARSVTDVLGPEDVTLLTGKSATREALLARLPTSTHVHLACHAQSSFLGEPLTAALSLSGEELCTVADVLDTSTAARMVVLSACETSVVQGYEAVDEVMAISTGFLAAGAASVVSTLWAIDDLAAALCMTRFYELLAAGSPPVEALRTAQLWLRGVSSTEVEAYAASRPALERRRAMRHGAWEPGEQPYSAYEHWAPFLFVGA